MVPSDTEQETSLKVPSELLAPDNNQDGVEKGAMAKGRGETFLERTLSSPLKSRDPLGHTVLAGLLLLHRPSREVVPLGKHWLPKVGQKPISKGETAWLAVPLLVH